MASPLINYGAFSTLPEDPTPEQLAEWLTSGRATLRDAAEPLRLWDVIQSGRSTELQRRKLLGRLIDGAKVQLGDLARWLADNLAKGVSTLNGWWQRFAGTMAAHHYAGSMAATGTPNLTPADKQSADGQVRKQLGFLGRFREQLRTGAQALFAPKVDPETNKKVVNGRFVARSELYGDAVYATAEAVIRDKMARDGYTYEKWILDQAAHHCSQCPSLAARGWVPIGELPAIGETICRTSCRCHIIYGHDDDYNNAMLLIAKRPA